MQENQIINEDCFTVMPRIESGSVDAVITDPPYYIASLKADLRGTSLRRSSRNDVFFSPFDHFESLNHYQAWNIQLLGEIKRILRPNGQVYMFGSYLHLDWMIAMIKTLGFRYYKPLIWYKPDICGLFPNQYGCNYEIIHWFRKKSPQKCPYKVTNHIGCSQKDVFTHNSTHINDRREGGFHPTVKPVNLCRRFIKNSTNEGDLVFDPFAGSGTTLVAAKQTRRRYLGCEINPEYVETIKRRLQQENLLQIIQKNGDATLTL